MKFRFYAFRDIYELLAFNLSNLFFFIARGNSIIELKIFHSNTQDILKICKL